MKWGKIENGKFKFGFFSQRVATKEGDTTVMVYFDDISAVKTCPVFRALRNFNVALQKPAPLVVFDYYDNCKSLPFTFFFIYIFTTLVLSPKARSARTFYDAPSIGLCDICNGVEACIKKCEADNS